LLREIALLTRAIVPCECGRNHRTFDNVAEQYAFAVASLTLANEPPHRVDAAELLPEMTAVLRAAAPHRDCEVASRKRKLDARPRAAEGVVSRSGDVTHLRAEFSRRPQPALLDQAEMADLTGVPLETVKRLARFRGATARRLHLAALKTATLEVVLCALAGNSRDEIARYLGISPATVRRRLITALSGGGRLKARLHSAVDRGVRTPSAPSPSGPTARSG
jgi:hypothetical protein